MSDHSLILIHIYRPNVHAEVVYFCEECAAAWSRRGIFVGGSRAVEPDCEAIARARLLLVDFDDAGNLKLTELMDQSATHSADTLET